MMKRVLSTGEEGQALIQVSIAMIVLLGFAALAIDVSFGYSQRRDMQNAADAGALAGAYEMCFASGNPVTAKAVAEEYANQPINRAVGANAIVEGALITVTAPIVAPTLFARVFGSSELTVTAQAVSACGRANAACGLWPIGFQESSWTPVEKNCGQKFVMWDSDGSVDCTVWDCVNIREEKKTDIVAHVITETLVLDGRAWLDFSAVLPDNAGDYCDGSGCGVGELNYRLEGKDNKGNQCRSYGKLGSCTPGSAGEGVAASAWSTAGAEAPRVITFPLYSTKGGCDLEPDVTNKCGNEGNRYPLSSFGCAKIHGNYTLCKIGGCTGSGNSMKVLVAEVACGPECASTCGTTTGELAGPGDVKAAGILK
jgi:hypothetical protein